jgi:tetratricopeptide (TPR) repeat protein
MSDQATLLAKIDEYKTTLSQDPKSTVFVQLCDAYLQLEQIDDALEVALKGTWELPQFADGYVAVGRVYYYRNVVAKAEAAFYKALSVDQMCIPAYKGLATILKDQGDLPKASDILTKAIMLDPGDTSLQQMIESLSSPSGAAQEVNQVVSAPITHQEPVMDQSSDSMKPITTATIADIYIEQGLYDKALDVYRELLTENPQDVTVQQKISELQGLMNNSSAPVSAAPVEPQAITPDMSFANLETGSSNVVLDRLNGWLAAIQARRNRV